MQGDSRASYDRAPAQIKAAADKHPEFKVAFKDAQNDTLKQRSHVEEFVSAGVDLLIISPKEAAPLTEPVAKAMELLDDRWTMLIVRELVTGSQHFNELRRGVPRISPTLLSRRQSSVRPAV